MRHRFQQVLKLAQRVRPDRVALVAHQVVGHLLVLAQIHVEVIQPEVRHHFLQLRIRIDVARQPLGKKFSHYSLFGSGKILDRLSQIRAHAGHQRRALHWLQRFDKALELLRLHRLQPPNPILRLQCKNIRNQRLVRICPIGASLIRREPNQPCPAARLPDLRLARPQAILNSQPWNSIGRIRNRRISQPPSCRLM